jgi:hypothetical protein
MTAIEILDWIRTDAALLFAIVVNSISVAVVSWRVSMLADRVRELEERMR